MNTADDSLSGGTDRSGGGDGSGMPEFSAGAAPESIEFLRRMIEGFNRSAAGLQQAYLDLQKKFDQLNLRLEETNRNLSRSLEEQERLSNYLTSILESLSSGVLVVDTNGVLTLFNRGAEEMTGIPVAEAVGGKYREIMGDGVPDELTPLGILAGGPGVSQLEKTIISRTGSKITVGYSTSPLVNRHGAMIGAVEIFMNLSRIKALEDELSRMDKLAALGQMAATMAHKIRNPLGGITGFTGLLELELDGSERGKRLTGKIMEGADKLNRIVTSLVSYTAPLRFRSRPCDLGGLMRELAARYEMERRIRGIEAMLTVDEPEGPAKVELDSEQFSDAAGRILLNALESLDGYGEVRILVLPGDTRYAPECTLTGELLNRIRNGSRLLGSRMPSALVTVTDTGCGMGEEEQVRLFVPFYTTKENGIGLGLAAARKIIEGHRGELWLVSREGFGTAVGVVLPSVSTGGGEFATIS